jgi:hypothetical protein
MHITSVIRGRLPLLLGALVAASAIAACGSSSHTTSSAASAASGTSGTSARTTLVACLKQHGVTLPNGGRFRRPGGAGAGPYGGGGGLFGGSGGNGGPPPGAGAGGRFAANPKLRAALQACGGSRFRRPTGTTAAQFRQRREAQVATFVACVKQHGYTLPKPNFSGTGPVFPASIEKNKAFQAAAKSCASALQPRRPPSTTTAAG